MSPILVALLKNGFDPVDGSAECLVNYALCIKRAGHRATVLYANPGSPRNQYLLYLKRNGIKARYLGRAPGVLRHRLLRLASLLPGTARHTRSWPAVLEAALVDSLRRSRVDLVHAFVDPAAPLALRAAAAAGIPSLCQELISPRPSPETGRYYDELAALLPHSTLAAQSERLAQECRAKIPYSGPVEIIPNIVQDPGEASRSTGSRADAVIIGFASRFEARKDPETLVRAFARALRRKPQIRLRMAGEGPLAPHVQGLAEELGIRARCEFLAAYTSRTGRDAFFRSIDVLVQPSRAEGLPNTVLEAMAYGRTIVSTAVGGIADVLGDESALLVRVADVDGLASALVRVCDEGLRASFGKRARDIYLRSFSPHAVRPVLLGAYDRAMAKHRELRPKAPPQTTPGP